jgi:predicted nucleic acid-binding protein
LPIDTPRSLGEGEREAIAIALHLASHSSAIPFVVTNDKRARATCRRLGIKVIGTLGLIELAKKNNVITKREALALLDRIPQTSLYATQQIIKEAKDKIRTQKQT